MQDWWAQFVLLDDGWKWLSLALLLAIGELVVPGVFLIWLAAGAAVVGGLTLVTDIPVTAQLLLFAILAIVAVAYGRRWYAKSNVPNEDPLLNHRAARMVGEIVLVTEAIANGRGRVKVADSVWSCRGGDAAVGAKVRVTGADGAVLLVEPV